MHRLLILLLIGGMVNLSACNIGKGLSIENLPQKTKTLIDADNSFGLDMFQRILTEAEPGENVCISPLSVSLALAMTYNGAAGDTRIAMEETLKMAGFTRDEINELYRDLTSALESDDPKVELGIANSVWYRDDFNVLEDFVERNEVYYEAAVRSLDFTNPSAKDVINGWVSDQTKKKIESIIGRIPSQSLMFLINAIYFKGQWQYEFDKKDTEDLPFYLGDGSVKDVPSMSLKEDFNMLKTDVFNAVELPYGKGNWVMYVLVPNGSHKVSEIYSDLSSESWNEHLGKLHLEKKVKLQLPKWKSEFKTSLKTVLSDMGMSLVFSDGANFSDISTEAPIQVSDVMHKTFIEVNEEGTEAAAMTSSKMYFGSTSTIEYFVADKPFVYLICEKRSGTVLFAGTVEDPTL